jgi:hypothetical protein
VGGAQIKETDMFVTPQRVAATAGALFLCAAVAAIAQPAADGDGARFNALETAAVSTGRPAARPQPTTPAPAVSGVPAMRAIEADDGVSGSEPDPETFDRHGLEIWWQGHMQKKP